MHMEREQEGWETGGRKAGGWMQEISQVTTDTELSQQRCG
jgi:hypothetical protein